METIGYVETVDTDTELSEVVLTIRFDVPGIEVFEEEATINGTLFLSDPVENELLDALDPRVGDLGDPDETRSF